MKLLERRKATQVRKKREARRESRTILRLASLLSRRMVAGCLNGEYAGSLSSKEPMMFLCNSDKAGGRKVGSENNNGNKRCQARTDVLPISSDRKAKDVGFAVFVLGT